MNGAHCSADRPSPHTPHPVQTGGVHVTLTSRSLSSTPLPPSVECFIHSSGQHHEAESFDENSERCLGRPRLCPA
jgi:hypothetical protein